MRKKPASDLIRSGNQFPVKIILTTNDVGGARVGIDGRA
jgi:hypothetical protein